MRVFKKWCTPIVQKKGLGFQNPKIKGCTGFPKVPTVTQCFHSFPPKVALDTNFAHDDDGDDVWGLCGLSVESLWSQCGLSGLKTNKVYTSMQTQKVSVEAQWPSRRSSLNRKFGAQRLFEGAQIGSMSILNPECLWYPGNVGSHKWYVAFTSCPQVPGVCN